MYHFCYTNPSAWPISSQHGVYGNVDSGNANRKTFLGKLGDLVAIAPGDKIFFYIKTTKALAGVFQAVGEPYFCQDNLFGNPQEKYSFRFNFLELHHFENPIPTSELAKLLQKGLLSSLTTFERDRQAGFRGIRQLTDDEGHLLEETLLRFNPKGDTTATANYVHPVVGGAHELIDIVEDVFAGHLFPTPVEISFSRIPVEEVRKGDFRAHYENTLQAYIFYSLRRNLNNVTETLELTNFTEALMEFPLLKAEQYRSDLLCLFRKPGKSPHFYSIIETKKDSIVPIEDLSQLIGYMKTFSAANNLPFNALEGVYISSSFAGATENYLHSRRQVEQENLVRLVEYTVDAHGNVAFTPIII